MNSQDALSSAAQLQAKLPRPLHSLAELAYNFWWSWSFERLSIFRTIDAEKWEQFHHNPLKILKKVLYERLVQLALDPQYLQRVKTLTAQFEQYIQQKDTWATQTASEIGVEPVAYFSIEYGLHQSLPLYAGGLGILAADHLKSASDLGLPLVGVGLLYRQGYFHQRFTSQGWQEEDYIDYQFEELPVELLRIVLGIGGVKALQLLGINPQVYHLNEGHAAFALL